MPKEESHVVLSFDGNIKIDLAENVWCGSRIATISVMPVTHQIG